MDWIEDEDLREALKEMKTYVDITEDDLKRIFNLALEHARRRLSKKIAVKDLMTEKVITVREDMTLDKIAEILSENRISGAPVVDLQNRVIGIITEADIISQTETVKTGAFRELLRHLMGEPVPKKSKKSLSELKVKDVMTAPAITASPDTDIREVARILDEKRIKRLPVVDEDGKLIGIISRQDIVRFLSHESS